MTTSFTFTTAAHIPLSSIIDTINLVYPNDGDNLADYAAMMATSQITPAHSIIALDDSGQVAGLAMLAIRGTRGWVCDVAVLPSYQNRKLGQELMRRLSDEARRIGLSVLLLDVRDNNAPARRVYEKEGYQYTRRTPCYQATREQMAAFSGTLGLSLRRISDAAEAQATLLRWFDPRYAPVPCWERELPNLLSAQRVSAWIASREDVDSAFFWAGLSSDRKTLQIGLLAVAESAADADILALCALALADSDAEFIRIGLEPIDSRVAVLFRAAGFSTPKDLWEMAKPL